MQLLLVVALLFALGVAVFAVQNAEPIAFQLFGWQSETSLVFIVLGAAAAGAVTTGLIGLVRQVKSSLRIRQLHTRLQKAEQQVQLLQAELDAKDARPAPDADQSSSDSSKFA